MTSWIVSNTRPLALVHSPWISKPLSYTFHRFNVPMSPAGLPLCHSIEITKLVISPLHFSQKTHKSKMPTLVVRNGVPQLPHNIAISNNLNHNVSSSSSLFLPSSSCKSSTYEDSRLCLRRERLEWRLALCLRRAYYAGLRIVTRQHSPSGNFILMLKLRSHSSDIRPA